MMHANAYDLNGFLLQICCISLAPAFFSAAIYLCLSGMYVCCYPQPKIDKEFMIKRSAACVSMASPLPV